jgi:uncharacterized protein (TIGR03067 family)
MIARYVVMVSAILVLASGLSAGGDEKAELDKLQGEWMVVSVETSGQKQDENQYKGLKVVVKGTEWTPPRGKLMFTFTIDPTKKPKQLDLEVKGGSTWQGIYKIEGDTLTFCRSHAAGGERPKEFKGGEGVFLMVCKRAGK